MRLPTCALVLGPLLLGGCSLFGGLSSEDASRLAAFAERAESYYRGKDDARALQQIHKGLAIDPDDYRLNQLLGLIHLREAKADPEAFRTALAQFEKVEGLRGDGEHDYITYIGLGEAHQGLYQLHRKRARALVRRAQGLPAGPERDELRAKAEENRRLARRHLDLAERAFRRLIAMGDGLLQAHRFLFRIAADRIQDLEGEARRRQYDEAIRRGLAYLKIVLQRKRHYEAKQDQVVQSDLPAAVQIGLEEEAKRRWREFRTQEMECRGILHSLYYHSGRYAEAIEQLDALLALDPTQAAEYYNRALCHLKLGHREQARRDFEDFLRLTTLPFDAPKVREANAHLRRLTSPTAARRDS